MRKLLQRQTNSILIVTAIDSSDHSCCYCYSAGSYHSASGITVISDVIVAPPTSAAAAVGYLAANVPCHGTNN